MKLNELNKEISVNLDRIINITERNIDVTHMTLDINGNSLSYNEYWKKKYGKEIQSDFLNSNDASATVKDLCKVLKVNDKLQDSKTSPDELFALYEFRLIDPRFQQLIYLLKWLYNLMPEYAKGIMPKKMLEDEKGLVLEDGEGKYISQLDNTIGSYCTDTIQHIKTSLEKIAFLY
jgi:hypothetical protein